MDSVHQNIFCDPECAERGFLVKRSLAGTVLLCADPLHPREMSWAGCIMNIDSRRLKLENDVAREPDRATFLWMTADVVPAGTRDHECPPDR
jgi:hypothetical protein